MKIIDGIKNELYEIHGVMLKMQNVIKGFGYRYSNNKTQKGKQPIIKEVVNEGI